MSDECLVYICLRRPYRCSGLHRSVVGSCRSRVVRVCDHRPVLGCWWLRPRPAIRDRRDGGNYPDNIRHAWMRSLMGPANQSRHLPTSNRWLAGFPRAGKDAHDAEARGRRGIMLSGLLAVLIVGTLAGSVEADRGDGCYRAQCYPRYDRGYYGGVGGEQTPKRGGGACGSSAVWAWWAGGCGRVATGRGAG